MSILRKIRQSLATRFTPEFLLGSYLVHSARFTTRFENETVAYQQFWYWVTRRLGYEFPELDEEQLRDALRAVSSKHFELGNALLDGSVSHDEAMDLLVNDLIEEMADAAEQMESA